MGNGSRADQWILFIGQKLSQTPAPCRSPCPQCLLSFHKVIWLTRLPAWFKEHDSNGKGLAFFLQLMGPGS